MPSLESLSSLGFEEKNMGCPGNFAGMSRIFGGVQKVCAKESSCAFFVPYLPGGTMIGKRLKFTISPAT